MTIELANKLLRTDSPQEFRGLVAAACELDVDDVAVLVPYIVERIRAARGFETEWYRIGWYLAWLGREMAKTAERRESMEVRAYQVLAALVRTTPTSAELEGVREGLEAWINEAADGLEPEMFSHESTADLIRSDHLERIRQGRRLKNRLQVLRELPNSSLSHSIHDWMEVWDWLP